MKSMVSLEDLSMSVHERIMLFKSVVCHDDPSCLCMKRSTLMMPVVILMRI